MKPVLFLLIISMSLGMSYSQEEVKEPSHYIFPEFTKGTVLLKSGIKNEALLNYNAFTEEMVFDDKGEKYAIAKEGVGLIDTVLISDRKFISLNNLFLELLCHSTFDLYAEHKCKVNSTVKSDGFRGNSETSAITSNSSYYGGLNRERGNMEKMKVPEGFYELVLPDGYVPEPYTYYWLDKNGELNRFVSLKQLMKLYPGKEDLFKAYVKKNDVKINNPENIVRFIQYLERN